MAQYTVDYSVCDSESDRSYSANSAAAAYAMFIAEVVNDGGLEKGDVDYCKIYNAAGELEFVA